MIGTTVGRAILLALCVGLVGATSAIAQDRVSSTEKGSVLIFPKVEVRWDAAGNVIQDTFLDLTNDFPGNVSVKMYFVHGDGPLAAEVVRQAADSGRSADEDASLVVLPPGRVESSARDRGGDPVATLPVTLMDAAGALITDADLSFVYADGPAGKVTANVDGVYEIPDDGDKLTLRGSLADGRALWAEVTLPRHDADEITVRIAADAQPPFGRIIPQGGFENATVPVPGPLPDAASLSASIQVVPPPRGGGGTPPTAPQCVDCSANATPENEPNCGLPIDSVNGGCNLVRPLFSPISCGETVCGTGALDLGIGLRDTDWYRLVLTEATEVTWSVTAEFDSQIAILANGGIDDCAALSGAVADNFGIACGTASVTACLPPGVWWLFVAPLSAVDVPCGATYEGTVTCSPCGPPNGCGDVGAGDCCTSNGTPFCDDLACCAIVCVADPFCCDSVWDGICAAEAAAWCATCGGVPPNDLCTNAFGPLDVPSITVGTTENATVDTIAPFCDVGVTSPGVWYTVIGTGNTMTASLCHATAYDSKLSVYCGPCDDLTCVVGDDDFCGLQSEVSWCSEPGVEYRILVHGFGGATGFFELQISDDGVPCGRAVACVPTGACCEGHRCSIQTELVCLSLGGEYLGDGTNCDEVLGTPSTYSAAPAFPIPDCNTAGIFHTITVPDSFTIGDVNVGVGVSHTFVGDLCVTLEHNGTWVTVIKRMQTANECVLGCGGDCGCFRDNLNVILDDEGTGGWIEDVCTNNPTSLVNYLPEEALAAFDGMDASGDWTITVTDYDCVGTGTLNNWKLIIDEQGGKPPCGVPERAHPGWGWVDVGISLTGNQPCYWSAATGQPKGVSPWTILDPGDPPGRPDPDGSDERVLRGYVVAWAVNAQGAQIRWNHLKGDTLIIHYGHGTAWEHNAFAFQALSASHGSPVGTAGAIKLDGTDYDEAFDVLLLDFYAIGATNLSPAWFPGGVTADLDLTLFPVDLDVRQDGNGPVTTKAKFDVWNQNEVKFTNMTRCITCWDQALASRYDAPNHFWRTNLQTDKGKARIDGLPSSVCPGSDAPRALLGVAAKMLDYAGAFTFIAGTNVPGMGTQPATINYDPSGGPPPAQPGGRSGASVGGSRDGR